jgi:hypothetical protein
MDEKLPIYGSSNQRISSILKQKISIIFMINFLYCYTMYWKLKEMKELMRRDSDCVAFVKFCIFPVCCYIWSVQLCHENMADNTNLGYCICKLKLHSFIFHLFHVLLLPIYEVVGTSNIKKYHFALH